MSAAAEQPVAGQPPKKPDFIHLPASRYVTAQFYDWIMDVSADLNQPVVRPMGSVESAIEHEITQLLTVEARLLDQGGRDHAAFTQWIKLFAEQCVYWVPGSGPAADPRHQVTLEFHDRRRLLDRVTRLGTGLAYSQIPASRTSRQWSGLEIWPSPRRTDEWRARYSFGLFESRAGHTRTLAGWNGFVLRQIGDGLGMQIVLKQINLIDNDYWQGNNSFFL
jgi:benzoate/toluate 1,2-dioxygenase beta subunit